MRTTRIVSSFLKFNLTNTLIIESKDYYFNGLGTRRSKLNFDPKWSEIGMNIVVILTFLTL
jgi:hypothetical protein